MKKYHFDYPLDSPERTMSHREIIMGKKVLRNIYLRWYELFISELQHLPNDIFVELGSGGGFLKEIEPRFICSDIIDLPSNDMTFSALDMPFPDNSVGGLFMIDTLHHISDSKKFLSEADRVMAPKGRIVMIEPANTLWGRFIYRNFHHEPFITSAGWEIPMSGPLSGANGALPWIIFVRDRKLFDTQYPQLKVEKVQYINPLAYLFSGGVSRQQILPDFAFPVINFLDSLLPLVSSQLSMFMVVRIRKI